MSGNNGRGIMLPGQGLPVGPAPIQVAAPMNDVQLVAQMAAHLSGTAAERVALAQEIVVEAITGANDLSDKIQRRMQEQQGGA